MSNYIAVYDNDCAQGRTIEEALKDLVDNVGCETEDCEVFELGNQIEFEVKEVIVVKPVAISTKKVSK